MLGSDLSFTVDQSFMLTQITQSIHNPLGDYASVNKSCSVIYLIDKIINIPQQVPEQEEEIPPPQPRLRR